MIVPSVSNGAGYGLEVPAQFFATPARHRVGRRGLTERTTCLRSVNPRSLITRIGSLSNHPESARSRRKDRRKSTLLRTSPAPRLRRKDIHGKLRCSQTEYSCLRGTRSARLCHTLENAGKGPIPLIPCGPGTEPGVSTAGCALGPGFPIQCAARFTGNVCGAYNRIARENFLARAMIGVAAYEPACNCPVIATDQTASRNSSP